MCVFLDSHWLVAIIFVLQLEVFEADFNEVEQSEALNEAVLQLSQEPISIIVGCMRLEGKPHFEGGRT